MVHKKPQLLITKPDVCILFNAIRVMDIFPQAIN